MEPEALLRLILLHLLKQAIVGKRRLSSTQVRGAKSLCRHQAVCPPLGSSVPDLPRLALLLAQGSWPQWAHSTLWKSLVQPLLTSAAASKRGARGQVLPESRQQRHQTPRPSGTTRRRANRRMSTSYLSTASYPTVISQQSPSPRCSPSSLSTNSSLMPAVELSESGVLLDLSKVKAVHEAPSLIPLTLSFKVPSGIPTSLDLETAREIGCRAASQSIVSRTSIKGDNPHAATTCARQNRVEAPCGCRDEQEKARERCTSLPPTPCNPFTVRALPLPPPAHQQHLEHLWHLQARDQQLEQQRHLLQGREGQEECQHCSTTATQTYDLQLPPLLCRTRPDSLLAAEVACRRQDVGSGSDVAGPPQPDLFPGQPQEATRPLAEETSECLGQNGLDQRPLARRPPPCKRPQGDTGSQAAFSAGARKRRTLAGEVTQQQATRDVPLLPAEHVTANCSSELPRAGSAREDRTRAPGSQDDPKLREDRGALGGGLASTVSSGRGAGTAPHLAARGDGDPSTSSGTCQDPSSSGSASRRCLAPLPRYKRQSHIDAEHRRRDKISKGVEALQTLIPSLRPTSSGHPRHSKAAMFCKTSDHIRRLQSEVERREEELIRLRQEALGYQAELQQQIQHLQQVQESTSQWSAQSNNKEATDDQLDSYIRSAVADNWKFGIFGFVVRALYDTYVKGVSAKSCGEFVATVLDWAKENLTLVNLRPVVVAALRVVGTKTSIVNRPEQLRHEILALTFHTDLSP